MGPRQLKSRNAHSLSKYANLLINFALIGIVKTSTNGIARRNLVPDLIVARVISPKDTYMAIDARGSHKENNVSFAHNATRQHITNRIERVNMSSRIDRIAIPTPCIDVSAATRSAVPRRMVVVNGNRRQMSASRLINMCNKSRAVLPNIAVPATRPIRIHTGLRAKAARNRRKGRAKIVTIVEVAIEPAKDVHSGNAKNGIERSRIHESVRCGTGSRSAFGEHANLNSLDTSRNALGARLGAILGPTKPPDALNMSAVPNNVVRGCFS